MSCRNTQFKWNFLGELSRQAFLEDNISRSAPYFASSTLPLTTVYGLPFSIYFSNDKRRFGLKHTTHAILWSSVTLPLKYCNLVLLHVHCLYSPLCERRHTRAVSQSKQLFEDSDCYNSIWNGAGLSLCKTSHTLGCSI